MRSRKNGDKQTSRMKEFESEEKVWKQINRNESRKQRFAER
jgi:hypothetical protein